MKKSLLLKIGASLLAVFLMAACNNTEDTQNDGTKTEETDADTEEAEDTEDAGDATEEKEESGS
ncbi:hypothetical protein ABET41_19580 [Metabacillus fastidiosus]|uniref:Lipoprotein n=1 Tax=Metabacillus fastidiosus TaxID=1458 RepID=A0ABU6P5V8_9BACI|nr:hypothetical protein [Metabacillus fastidiosus]MED4404072.1 hypothetical protein [Metabacillus fastidiosus]MED4462776.1 hypothetical protein [Metabacillus fastidiosus]